MAKFDGKTYDPALDEIRLTGQMKRVFDLMRDGKWRSLPMIQGFMQTWYSKRDSEAAISARLRDFRKERFGQHVVNKRRMASGFWEYQLVLKAPMAGLFDGVHTGAGQ